MKDKFSLINKHIELLVRILSSTFAVYKKIYIIKMECTYCKVPGKKPVQTSAVLMHFNTERPLPEINVVQIIIKH